MTYDPYPDMPPLTPQQISFVRRQVANWLYIKFKEEISYNNCTVEELPKGRFKRTGTARWGQEVSGLVPDADHSALLARLLSGKEPLPEPPPTYMSYPDYPD